MEQEIAMASASASVSMQSSPMERLEQLDRMKEIMTSEEYERKRCEILDLL
jgi:hypothetical protein